MSTKDRVLSEMEKRCSTGPVLRADVRYGVHSTYNEKRVGSPRLDDEYTLYPAF